MNNYYAAAFIILGIIIGMMWGAYLMPNENKQYGFSEQHQAIIQQKIESHGFYKHVNDSFNYYCVWTANRSAEEVFETECHEIVHEYIREQSEHYLGNLCRNMFKQGLLEVPQ